MASRGDADDIRDRIDRADFMEMNRLNRNVVDLRLRMTQQSKGLQRNRLHPIGEVDPPMISSIFESDRPCTWGSPGAMRVFMRMIVIVRVHMFMGTTVLMFMRVGVFVTSCRGSMSDLD